MYDTLTPYGFIYHIFPLLFSASPLNPLIVCKIYTHSLVVNNYFQLPLKVTLDI